MVFVELFVPVEKLRSGTVKLQLIIAIVLLWFFSSASAQQYMAHQYIGIGYGETDYDADDISSFDGPGGFETYFGYGFTENLAFEIGFVDFGEADDGISPNWYLSAYTVGISSLLKVPLGEKAEVFTQIGFHMWKNDISEDGLGVFDKDDGIDFFYGVGFNFNVSNKFGVGFRYNNYNFDDDDVVRVLLTAQINRIFE
jgi:hypothetical protein